MKLVAGIIGLILFLSVSLSADAIALVKREVILDAQEYGTKNKQMALTEFLQPWLVYEERAAILNETTERAYLYTPYLLLATDARDKARSNQVAQLADSEKILSDYAGCLVFSITLHGNAENFTDGVQVVILQDKKLIKPYHYIINPPVKASWFPGEPQFTAHSYFYFHDQDINSSKPIILVATTKNKSEHRFNFNLPNFK